MISWRVRAARSKRSCAFSRAVPAHATVVRPRIAANVISFFICVHLFYLCASKLPNALRRIRYFPRYCPIPCAVWSIEDHGRRGPGPGNWGIRPGPNRLRKRSERKANSGKNGLAGAKQTAEKGSFMTEMPEKRTSGVKGRIDSIEVMSRISPGPTTRTGFFRSL